MSVAKVDMLFAQIPRNILKRISADLSINLGLVSVTLKEKEIQQTLFDKLKVVTMYLNEHVETGTVDNPGSDFKGILPMRWGLYAGSHLVYFGGETNKTIFGLGGSMYHIIGEERGQSPTHSQSASHAIFSILEHGRDDSLDQNIINESLEAVKMATEKMKGPQQPLDFLAKRLVEGTFKSKHILLGSPIYVAYGD